jgi:Flp pilus assembly protein TadD
MNMNKLLNDEKEFFRQSVDKSRQGNYGGVIQALDRALQLHPTDADAYGHRCVARHRVGDKQGAIADCQQAAKLYLEQGKLKEYQYAVKMLKKLQA